MQLTFAYRSILSRFSQCKLLRSARSPPFAATIMSEVLLIIWDKDWGDKPKKLFKLTNLQGYANLFSKIQSAFNPKRK